MNKIMAWPLGATLRKPQSMCAKGFCKEIKMDIPNKRITRKIMARKRPMFLALGWSTLGSREAVMDMKMMLSIPKTISKKVKVNKLTKLSRLNSDSIQKILSCKDGVFQADNQ